MGQIAGSSLRGLRLAAVALAIAVLPAASGAQQVPPPADALAELRASVAEMNRLMTSGKRLEAVALAEAVERRLSAALGREHALVASSLYNLGQAYKAVARPQDAVEAFEAALAIETRVSAPGAESYRRTLNALAGLERDRGRPARSIDLYKTAIVSLGDASTGEAAVARAEFAEEAGQLLRHMGSYPDAEKMLKDALETRERLVGPGDGTLAGTLNKLAGISRVQGKHAEAESHYKRAIAIATATKGPRDANTAILMDNLAVLYQQTGRLIEAEGLQRRALTIFDEVLGLDHLTSAQAAANLAANFQAQDRHGEALALYERVLDVYLKKLPDNDARLGIVFDNIAGVLRTMGRLDSAMGFYQRALATLEKAYPPEHPEIGVALNNLSVVHSTLRRFPEAESYAHRALKIAHATHGDSHPGVAISLGNLADALAGQGRTVEARGNLERAIGIIEGLLGKEHPMLVLPLHQISSLLVAEGRIAEALGPARRAVAIENATRSRERQLRQDRQERSRSKGEALAKLLDALWRSGEKDPALREGAARESFEALQSGSASQAGIAIQQLGARLGAAKPELATLVRERQDLAAQWSDADKALGAAVARRAIDRKPEQEASLRARLAELDRRLVAIDRRIETDFAAYQELSQQRPLDADAAMELLRVGEALLAYRVEEKDVYVWVLSEGRIVWQRLPIAARQLADQVQALRCGLDAGEWAEAKRAGRCQGLTGKPPEGGLLPFRADIASALYQMLVAPLQSQIGGKHLLISATGSLTSLPFGVLMAQAPADGSLKGAGWLGVSNAITTLPTVASLRTLRRDARPAAARKPYLGVGNPLLEGPTGDATLAFAAQSCIAPRPGRSKTLAQTATSPLPSYYLRGGAASPAELRQLSPLPETRDEICSVAAKLGAGEDDVMLGSRASERLLRELNAVGGLAEYRVVHFATHGLVAGEISGLAEPALVLNPPAEATADNDGLLTASEVATLGLDADWVIMSACNTASGDRLGAEALSGLARSFFYGGARSLLVSHWPVQSSAAVKLTTGALAELQGDAALGRAEALRRAMAALIADTSEEGNWHPQVWAPFVVVGEGGGGLVAAASSQSGPTATANEKAGSTTGGSPVPPVTAAEPAPAGRSVGSPATSRPAAKRGAPKSAAGAIIRKDAKETLPWAQPGGGSPVPATKQSDPRPAKPPQKIDPASVFRPY